MLLQVNFIFFIKENGEVYSFGENDVGQFGNGYYYNSNIPILMNWKCKDIINNPYSYSCFIIH